MMNRIDSDLKEQLDSYIAFRLQDYMMDDDETNDTFSKFMMIYEMDRLANAVEECNETLKWINNNI